MAHAVPNHGLWGVGVDSSRSGRFCLPSTAMGSCIICGELVSADSGNAWKITPVDHRVLGFQPMHWIHATCIELAKGTTSPTLRAVR